MFLLIGVLSSTAVAAENETNTEVSATNQKSTETDTTAKSTESVETKQYEGLFVGLDVGSAINFFEDTITLNAQSETASYQAGDLALNVVAGWQKFLSPRIGWRTYLHLGYNDLSGKFDYQALGATFQGEYKNFSAMKIGANFDFLANIIATEKFDFGGFLGVRLGMISWDKLNANQNDPFNPYKETEEGFDAGLNVGLRINIVKKHAIELVVYVPFTEIEIAKDQTIQGFNGTVTTKLSSGNGGIRYIYAF